MLVPKPVNCPVKEKAHLILSDGVISRRLEGIGGHRHCFAYSSQLGSVIYKFGGHNDNEIMAYERATEEQKRYIPDLYDYSKCACGVHTWVAMRWIVSASECIDPKTRSKKYAELLAAVTPLGLAWDLVEYGLNWKLEANTLHPYCVDAVIN